jgi:hypothetical protein
MVLQVTNGPDRGGVTSPLVIILLKALVQCGGPVPRPPQKTIKHQDSVRLDGASTVWTHVVEEMEWLNGVQMGRPAWGGRPRQPQWREAAALQRSRCVREYSRPTIEYDPDVIWVPTPVSAAATAVIEAERRELNVQLQLPFKRQRC